MSSTHAVSISSSDSKEAAEKMVGLMRRHAGTE